MNAGDNNVKAVGMDWKTRVEGQGIPSRWRQFGRDPMQ